MWQGASLDAQSLLQRRQEAIGRRVADSSTTARYSTIYTEIRAIRTLINGGTIDVGYVSHHGEKQKIC